MRELYIAFSPYHVLLACALALDGENAAECHMFVILNSQPTPSIVSIIDALCKDIFTEICWLEGVYKKRRRFAKALVFRRDTLEVRRLIGRHSFDRIFVPNDEGPEAQAALFFGKQINPDAVGVYFEDGSGAYSSFVNRERSSLQMLLGRCFFGMPWCRVKVLGTSPWIDEVYVAFPELVRVELSGKRVLPIFRESVLSLANRLSEAQIEELTGITLSEMRTIDAVIALMHSDIVQEVSAYSKAVERLIDLAETRSVNLAIKYHPREPREDYLRLSTKDSYPLILPKALPLELLYILCAKSLGMVIGDVSTAVLTAKWLLDDAKIICMAPLIGETDMRLLTVYRMLDIELLADFSDLEYIFD